MVYIPDASELAEMFDAHERAVKGEWKDEELTPEELDQLDRDTRSDDGDSRWDHLKGAIR